MTTELNLVGANAAGCTLDADGFSEQRDRVVALRSHVVEVHEEDHALRIEFDDAVDPALVAEFVAIEGACCGFLSLGYDRGDRVLRIATADADKLDVVRGFAGVFRGSVA